ncbi:MAG: hypothetical protein OQK11_00065 [Thiovulaceae bacterium]|nr:hypothetical protein [Sulfurimonadaceae bacterium]
MAEEKVNLKFSGSIFDEGLDLRDISFYSRKLSAIIDKSFISFNGSSSNIKNKYVIKTNAIKEACLYYDISIILSSVQPVLSNVTSIWDTASQAINLIKLLGKEDKMPTINIDNSIVNFGSGTISVPETVLKTALLAENDIEDLVKKIEKKELSTFTANNDELLSVQALPELTRGVQYIKEYKLQPLKEFHKAEILVYEFNTKTLTGKAFINNTELKDIETKESCDFNIATDGLQDLIINSMKKESINIEFMPIIKHYGSKQILEKMTIVGE